MRAFIRSSLQPLYRVVEAADGREGLRAAREQQPDLIVSDVMMPGVDGLRLVATLRADPELQSLPVILLTARASRDAVIEGMEGGADDYVTKPFEPAELRARIAAILTGRRRLRERWESEGRGSLPVLEVPLAPGSAGSRDEEFMAALYGVIAERFDDEDFGVEELARALALSRASLYRRLAGITDRSPVEAIRDYRLEQAALWLVQTDATVSQIAYGVGFKSVSHFGSHFRTRFGVAPGEYRSRSEDHAR